MLTFTLAGVILTLLFIWAAWKRFIFCQIVSDIPGPKAWPIVGNALQLKWDPHGRQMNILVLKNVLQDLCHAIPDYRVIIVGEPIMICLG